MPSSDAPRGTRFDFNEDFFDVNVQQDTSEEDLAAARAAGHDEGFAAGKAEGRQEAEATIKPALQAYQQAGQAVQEQVDGYVRALTKDAQNLLYIFFAEVLRDIETHELEELLKQQLAQALEVLPNTDRFTLYLHPDAIALHEKFQQPDLTLAHKYFTVTADTALKPADCRIEWGDGGLEVKVDHIIERLRQALNARRHPAETASNTTQHAAENEEDVTNMPPNLADDETNE